VRDSEVPPIVAYHEATKHHFYAYAIGPGRLDWATQPDPFRRYAGAPVVALEHPAADDTPSYDAAVAGRVPSRPVDASTIARLLYDSLALSAWKSLGETSWALRVNPSSGNLHPTEGYVVCGPVDGITTDPAVLHYAPREHALERRATFPAGLWRDLARELPPETLLVALTSIHWREAWKYGERAFRYCQHDAGHAIAAVAIAAAGLGWRARLLDSLASDEIAALAGVGDARGAEPEQPECVLAVGPHVADSRYDLPAEAVRAFGDLAWVGEPNALSPRHLDWPAVEAAAEETRKPRTLPATPFIVAPAGAEPDRSIPLRALVRARRSAVAMDGRTRTTAAAFYRMLLATLPGRVPHDALPWPPRVHFGLFVHRVDGLAPGLYVLARRSDAMPLLREHVGADFEWRRPDGCPEALELYVLAEADAARLAAQVSCHQDIAGDGCFSLGMLAEFAGPIASDGPWAYRRLFWECGLVGQVLYLEAEAAGLRATGIGCFFDDPVHEVFGVDGRALQSLYHFTVGGPLEDARLTTRPAYPAAEGRG
jgi:SagB-type dehydrogenase family enzyme